MHLTVIIPHYNDNNNLLNLLKILEGIPKTEIIVVDDCSEEKPPLSKKSHIIYLEKKQNAGYARNVGIRRAKGKYLMFLDSDDLIVPKICNIFFTSFLKRDLDVVFFRPEDFDKSLPTRTNPYNSIIDNFIQHKNEQSIEQLRYSINVPWCKFIKRDFLIGKNIWFDNLQAGNDLTFSIKIGFFMQNFDAINETGVLVRRRSSSLVSQNNLEILKSRLTSIFNSNKFIKEHDINISYIRYNWILSKALKLNFMDFTRFFLFFLKTKCRI